jgi:hypothetical protein
MYLKYSPHIIQIDTIIIHIQYLVYTSANSMIDPHNKTKLTIPVIVI